MASSPIVKVAVAGPTGTLGPYVVKHLVAAGFQVTALTRQATPSTTFPAGVTTRTVDFSSQSSLVSALRGQDAVVSTLNANTPDHGLALVSAAIEAGTIRHFIPSEFGSNTSNPKARALPVFGPKLAVQDALEQVKDKMAYTLIYTGPFLDWGLAAGWLMNAKEKKMTLYNGGNIRLSGTTRDGIGKAVAGVLKNAALTANKAVRVQELGFTGRELLALGQKAVGDDGWEVVEDGPSTEELRVQALEDLGKGENIPGAMFTFLLSAIFGEGYGQDYSVEGLDNEMLGIKELSEEDALKLIQETSK